MKKTNLKFLAAWRNRFVKYEAESLAMADRGPTELTEAVRILRNYGATRVVLCGSLCRIGRFHLGSDIDLAVEGIASRDFNRASADPMMAMDLPNHLHPRRTAYFPDYRTGDKSKCSIHAAWRSVLFTPSEPSSQNAFDFDPVLFYPNFGARLRDP